MSAKVKSIIVFGANGQTGLQILRKALIEGLKITAFVRTPTKIPENIRAQLHSIVKGDIFEKEKVEDSIQGHDAVLSALAQGFTFGTVTVSEGCQNILAGMKKHGVKRLVIVGAAQLLPDQNGPLDKFIRLFRNITDHGRQISLLEAEEDIDWILLMPYFIKNSAIVNPDYQVEINSLTGSLYVTTAELADFMIYVLLDEEKAKKYRRCKVGISSAPKTQSNN